MCEDYIIYSNPNDRELNAIKTFLKIYYDITQNFWKSLSFNFPYSFHIINFPYSFNSRQLEGDIDILSGNLLQLHNDIQWPPNLNFLTGVEVKCSYTEIVPEDGKIENYVIRNPNVDEIYTQIDKLLKLGLNKVTLLEINANPPTDNFLMSANIAIDSSMKKIKDEKIKIHDNSLSGHWIHSPGAVNGGSECMRGTRIPDERKKPKLNIILNDEMKKNRENFEKKLKNKLKDISEPLEHQHPVIMIYCEEDKKLYYVDNKIK